MNTRIARERWLIRSMLCGAWGAGAMLLLAAAGGCGGRGAGAESEHGHQHGQAEAHVDEVTLTEEAAQVASACSCTRL